MYGGTMTKNMAFGVPSFKTPPSNSDIVKYTLISFSTLFNPKNGTGIHDTYTRMAMSISTPKIPNHFAFEKEIRTTETLWWQPGAW
jgi:hypothetical protein